MNRFVIKLVLFSSPLLLVVLSYFICDPFKVLYNYKDIYENYFVNINRDYASTKLFIRNNPTYHYNSFILGSSRTIAFRTKDWKNHIGETAKPFVFDASSEKLVGIWSKLKFIDKEGDSIKHALIIVCGDHTFTDSKQTDVILLTRHYKVDKSKNWLQFQNIFFTSYFRNYFFIRYLDYRLFKTKRPYMLGNMDFINIKADLLSNDLYRVDLDQRLLRNPSLYYAAADTQFYQRSYPIKNREELINEKKLEMLVEIKTIFDKHHTDYRIIISPLYDQKKLNEKDVKTLQNIFGKEYVYDFSGVNEITDSKFNYYENSHYLPIVGQRIMDSIYSK